MNLEYIKGIIFRRYVYVLFFLAILAYVHWVIIPIHPLIFLVWSLSFWMLFEIVTRFKESRIRISLFIVSFIAYILTTNSLVVVSAYGIYFYFGPFVNLSTLSNFVLLEVFILFVYDTFITRSVAFKDIPAYVGFASVIPWLSPAIIEAYILSRWYLKGIFPILTSGKGIGGAGLQDILFLYGGRNLLLSSFIFVLGLIVLHGSMRVSRYQEANRIRSQLFKEDKEWLTNVWKNPLTLLNEEEQEAFLSSHQHLEKEAQNKILRDDYLPSKGITLIDPKTLK